MIKRIVILAIFVVCLFLNSCASMGCCIGGARADNLEITLDFLKNIKTRFPIFIITFDADTIFGTFERIERLSLDSYAQQYENYKKDNPDIILPDLNDNIIIVTTEGEEYPCQLLGFDQGKVIIKQENKETREEVKIKYIASITNYQKNQEISTITLAILTSDKNFPTMSQFMILVRIYQGATEKSVPVKDIKKMFRIRSNAYPLPFQYLSHVWGDSPIIFNEELGEAIDKAEADRCGLFVRIPDFKEAKFYPIDSGGFKIEIETENGVIKVTNMDPCARDIMTDYFQNIDAIRTDAQWLKWFNTKWQVLDYDEYGIPITRNETSRLGRNITNRIGGAILSCSGCCLLGIGVGGLVDLMNTKQPGMQGDWVFPELTTGDGIIVIGCVLSPLIGGPIGYIITEKLEEKHKVNLIKKNRSNKLK